MGLALACVVIILHDDWLIRSGENRLGRVLKNIWRQCYILHLIFDYLYFQVKLVLVYTFLKKHFADANCTWIGLHLQLGQPDNEDFMFNFY